ncbi:MAG TPA: type III-B CRISPR module-associated protein Cmr5 [Acetobacteraceae bacterium]|nr:type III-B CRISPR module-associated protein Cmr5 [Acetobacteraceae bacterium]
MSGIAATTQRPLRKDQNRALKAYEWAAAAKSAKVLGDYETAVQSFAAALLQSGLAVAISVLERSKERDEFKRLLENLAAYPAPGLPAAAVDKWPGDVRALSVASYMQATREFVALLAWLRRACRALEDKP